MPSPSFTSAGTVMPGGRAAAYNLSQDGSTAVGFADLEAGTGAVRWQVGTGLTVLPVAAAGGQTWGYAASWDGAAIVGNGSNGSDTWATAGTRPEPSKRLRQMPGSLRSLPRQ